MFTQKQIKEIKVDLKEINSNYNDVKIELGKIQKILEQKIDNTQTTVQKIIKIIEEAEEK